MLCSSEDGESLIGRLANTLGDVSTELTAILVQSRSIQSAARVCVDLRMLLLLLYIFKLF